MMYAYLIQSDGGVTELDGVVSVEPNGGEVCVTFVDGSHDYYECEDYEVETAVPHEYLRALEFDAFGDKTRGSLPRQREVEDVLKDAEPITDFGMKVDA